MRYERRPQAVEAICSPAQDGCGLGASHSDFVTWLSEHGEALWMYNAESQRGTIDGKPFGEATWIVKIEYQLSGRVGQESRAIRFEVLNGGQFNEFYCEVKS